MKEGNKPKNLKRKNRNHTNSIGNNSNNHNNIINSGNKCAIWRRWNIKHSPKR